MNLELSVVLPTYNERENLKVLIPRIEDTFKDTGHEIIVVDDNSPDGTGDYALQLNGQYGNIRLIKRVKREGIGAALRQGYMSAQGEIILSSDADLSFPVEDMSKLVNCIRDGYDFAIGCRHNISGSFYEMKRLRTAIKGSISSVGNFILRTLTGIKIHDFSANFRAIKKDAWDKLKVQENNNIMLFEMIVKARHKNLRLIEVPVSFIDRIYGESKLNLFVEIPKYILKMWKYILLGGKNG